MRLSELQKLTFKELKELAIKENCSIEGDKRVRVNWLISLEKHFEAKLPILADTGEYEVTYGKKTRYRFRSKNPVGPWVPTDTPLPQLVITLQQISQNKRILQYNLAVKEFRAACNPVRPWTRPP